MKGFHIDMNGGHYPSEYLRKWLRELADLGYDTILWEVENCIQWVTCPECVSVDAYTKNAFQDILAYGRELGLRPIPLLQTIGHAEYVLKQPKYQYLAEIPGGMSQYCPSNEALLPFLHQWIGEYLALFGSVEYFHIGADEAWSLGQCERCASKVEESSLSKLYVDHVNLVIEPILKAESIPIIWGDMILHHHDAIDLLHPSILIFDWMYDISCSQKKVFVWGEGLKTKGELSSNSLEHYGQYLFPNGDRTGNMQIFYTAEYLVDHGRDVVTCPGSSSYGDSVFAPRLEHHLYNCFDSMRKGQEVHLCGFMLTSWTVHLFPWELQRIFIAINQFLREEPEGDFEQYKTWYLVKYFSSQLEGFWEAVNLVSEPLRWAKTVDIGHSKKNLKISTSFISEEISKLTCEEKTLECKRTELLLRGYLRALGLFEGMNYTDDAEIKCWILAARNLIVRSRGVLILLDEGNGYTREQIEDVINGSIALMHETREMYDDKLCPSRKNEFIHWIYDAFHFALEEKIV